MKPHARKRRWPHHVATGLPHGTTTGRLNIAIGRGARLLARYASQKLKTGGKESVINSLGANPSLELTAGVRPADRPLSERAWQNTLRQLLLMLLDLRIGRSPRDPPIGLEGRDLEIGNVSLKDGHKAPT